MIARLLLMGCFVVGGGAARAEPGAATTATPEEQASRASEEGSGAEVATEVVREPLPMDAKIPAILDAMHAVGRDMQDLTAKIELASENATFGDTRVKMGELWLSRTETGDTLMRITFTTEMANFEEDPYRVDYLYREGWLVERNQDRKVQVRRQVLAPGEQLNPFELDGGPFPLPIGQNPEEVRRQFEITRPDEASDNAPADTIELTLEPKEGTRFAEKISEMVVWIDPQSHLPIQVQTLDRNETQYEIVSLFEPAVNQGIEAERFELPEIENPGEWNLVEEPQQRAAPQE